MQLISFVRGSDGFQAPRMRASSSTLAQNTRRADAPPTSDKQRTNAHRNALKHRVDAPERVGQRTQRDYAEPILEQRLLEKALAEGHAVKG